MGEKMRAVTRQATVINAEGLILGRMASVIAKRLLNGEAIIVVNAEKAVVSGKKQGKVREAKKFLAVGHPRKGPFHHRRPDRIIGRTVRGMLPYKQPKGKQAFKRLKVFIGVPDEFKGREMKTLEEAKSQKLKCPHFTLAEFAKEIGWTMGE